MANLGVMDLEDCQSKWNEVKARHGFAPDGTPVEKPVTGLKYGAAPQPASEGVRWFRDKYGTTRAYPSRKMLNADGKFIGTTDVKISECFDDTELDGPPPYGKPIAKQAKATASEVCSTTEPPSRSRAVGEISHDEAAAEVGSLYLKNPPTRAGLDLLAVYIAQQRAASVRVVELVCRYSPHHGPWHGIALKPGQSLAVIERPAEAAAGEGERP